MKFAKIPPATIGRLSIYTRHLQELIRQGQEIISSERLATLCSVNPAQIRKDLAYFGEFGVRGVGYYVKDLLFEIRKILGLNKEWNLAIVGMGNLGTALIGHENFLKQGYRFVAAFDNDPSKLGRVLPNGLKVCDIKDVARIKEETSMDIGVITTPPSRAQEVANRLVEAGIKGILNFAPVRINVPSGCEVEYVDFTIRLDSLTYRLSMQD
jgi:redox-sensing transcriptional repressor